MITSSYQEHNDYTQSVNVTESCITPGTWEDIARSRSLDLMNPSSSENLSSSTSGSYLYDPAHIDPLAGAWTGWTEKGYYNSGSRFGGAVRTVIMSGSTAELKRLKVDSEVDAETVNTSWSASIGQNIKVKGNAGIDGYLTIGPGSSENLLDDTDILDPDIRLQVQDSAVIREDLYVGDSASISGGLDVKGDTRLASNLYVTGSSEITGNLQVVGNEAITGSLHVNKSVYGSENLFLTGNAQITGNLQVVGDEAVTGSLHVSESIYGSENLTISGNAYISGNTQIVGNEAVTGSQYISGSLYVNDNTYLSRSLYVNGDAVVSNSLYTNKNAYVSQNLAVYGSESIGQGLTVGNDIQVGGTASIGGVTTIEGKTTIEDDLEVRGNELVTGSLTVQSSSILQGDLEVIGNTILHKNLTVDSDSLFRQNVVVGGDLTVHGTTTTLDTEELKVKDKSITVAMSASTPAQADGAGIDIAGADVAFRYSASTDRMGLNKGLDVSGDTNVTGNLAVTENTVISGSLQVVEDVITSGSISVDEDALVGGDLTVTGSAIISESLTVRGDETVSGSLTVNESIYTSENLQVAGNTYISGNSQIAGTQSVNVQNVTSQSVGNLQATSASVGFIRVDRIEVESEDPAEFKGDVVVEGDVSGSQSGSFKDLYVENNITAGNKISSTVLDLTGSEGTASINIATGSVNAPNSDFLVHSLTGSGNIQMSGTISASFIEGNGSKLLGVTASIASSSVWKSYLDFEGGASQTVTHPFESTDVLVQVYKWADPSFHPDTASAASFDSPAVFVHDATIKIIDTASVEISYPTDLNGYAVVADAGMLITASVDILQCATDIAEFNIPKESAFDIIEIPHKLGTKNVIVTFYRDADIRDTAHTVEPVQFIPEQVSIPGNSSIKVVFGNEHEDITGYVVIAKAGHVVKESQVDDSWIIDHEVHFGSTGSWTAESFGAVTMSANQAVVTDYVDTPKIGNLNTGEQYHEDYYEPTWGSYIEFTDRSIDSYLYDSASHSNFTGSSLREDGNLYLAGSVITDHPFYALSDQREKSNIMTLVGAVSALKQLRGVEFSWTKDGRRDIGVIAQEVQSIYPQLVHNYKDLSGEERLSVNYDGLVGVLIEAVKSLTERVEYLEQRVIG